MGDGQHRSDLGSETEAMGGGGEAERREEDPGFLSPPDPT